MSWSYRCYSGVKLVLDIGVIDTTTCKPFSNALVELWAGDYFVSCVLNCIMNFYIQQTLLAPMEVTNPLEESIRILSFVAVNSLALQALWSSLQSILDFIAAALPIFMSWFIKISRPIPTSTWYFLNFSNDGYLDAFLSSTFVSSSGSLSHIGQIFFDETWNTKVYATSPYTSNRQSRTLNSQDSILKGAGNSAYARYALLFTMHRPGCLRTCLPKVFEA